MYLSSISNLFRTGCNKFGFQFDGSTCRLGARAVWVTVSTVSLAAVNLSSADAQIMMGENSGPPGITVEGSGEVRSVPDVVEINLKLAAKGELTDDAVVKHRDAKKRALETFKALKIENLELEEKNLGLKAGGSPQEMMQMMWGGMPAAQNKRTQVEVGSTLRARLVGVGKVPTEELMSTIGRLLDAAQDSGAGLGMSDSDMMMMRYYGYGGQQTALVKFIVTNVSESREKAYELAVADARKRAERLARLSNIKLGSVLAIDEMATNMNRIYYNPYDANEAKEEKDEVVAETMSGGHFRVKLRVRFAIDTPEKPLKAERPAQNPLEGKKS